ncbi:hypothetical protein BGZ94_007185 [Podila epigama]|nr:hypothetical protein BGZ94_007185 [Podila epigama]
MGQSGLWQLLRDMGINGEPVDPKAVLDVHVDLPAILHGLLSRMDFFACKKLLRREGQFTTDDQIKAERLRRLTQCADKKLAEIFSKETATVHIDGAATIQKKHARDKRQAECQRKETDLQAKMALVETEIDAITKEGMLSAKRRRHLRLLYRRALAAWRTTFRLTPDLRVALAASLTGLGWTVCPCIGEADVCIATLAANAIGQGGPVHAATSDSDFLMYDNVVVLRQDPMKRSRYSLYPSDIVASCNEHLDVFNKGPKTVAMPPMTPEIWKVLAVTNSNDYSPGVWGYGLPTLWRTLAETWSALPKPSSPMTLLREFEARLKTRSEEAAKRGTPRALPDFRRTVSIFLDLREDVSPLQEPVDTSIEAQVSTMMKEFVKASRLLVPATRGSGSGSGSGTGNLPGGTMPSQPSVKSRKRKAKKDVKDQKDVQKPKTKKKKSTLNTSTKYTQQKEDAEEKARLAAAAGQAPTEIQGRKKSRGTWLKEALEANFRHSIQVLGPIEECLRKALFSNLRGNIEQFLAENTMCFGAQCNITSRKHAHLNVASENGDFVKPTINRLRLDIQQTLQGLAGVQKDLIWLGTLAIQRYVLSTFALYDSLSTAHARRRQDLFRPLLHNQSFFGAVVSELYHPTEDSSRFKADSRVGRNAARAFRVEFRAEFADVFTCVSAWLDGSIPNTFILFVGKQLEYTHRNHWSKFISELKQRALAANNAVNHPSFAAMLDSINDSGKSAVHDPISISWFIHAILAKDNRSSLFPLPGYGDGSTDITEGYLLQTLTRARMDQASKCLPVLYRHLFPQDDVQKRRGNMFMKLFYTGSGTNYNRQTVAIDSKLEPYASLITSVENQPKGSDARKAARKALADSTRASLLLSPVKSSKGKSKANQPQSTGRKKYVMRGSISTDGYQLNVHTIHLGHSRRDPTTSEGQISGTAATSATPSSMAPATAAASSSSSSSRVLRSSSSRVLRSSSSTSSSSSIRRRPGCSGRHRPEDVQREFGNQDSWVVTSLDPGTRQTASTATIDTLDTSRIYIHDIPTGDLRFNERLFKSRCNRAKRTSTDDILGVEAAAITFHMPDSPAAQRGSGAIATGVYSYRFSALTTEFVRYIRSVLSGFVPLRNFYSSTVMKRWQSQRKKDSRSEEDRAIQAIINTTNRPAKSTSNVPKRIPILAIGDGMFRGLRRVVDKSTGFRNKFVVKARVDGIKVFQVDEFRTSIRCSRCFEETEKRHRSLICSNCKHAGNEFMIDRDHNATTNMFQAVLSQIQTFSWPAHLQREL